MDIQQRYPNLHILLKSWQHQKGATILMQAVPLVVSACVGAELGFYEGLKRTPEQFSRLANINSVADAASAALEITGLLLVHSVFGIVDGGGFAADTVARYICENSNAGALSRLPDVIDPDGAEIIAALDRHIAEHPGDL